MPNSLLEAMVMGVPAIAFGIPDFGTGRGHRRADDREAIRRPSFCTSDSEIGCVF